MLKTTNNNDKVYLVMVKNNHFEYMSNRLLKAGQFFTCKILAENKAKEWSLQLGYKYFVYEVEWE